MKKILVSGAGGYIGCIMCEELLKQNYKVIALDRFFFGLDKVQHIDSENFSDMLGLSLYYYDPIPF